MIRTTTIALVSVLSLAALAGCEKSGREEQERANEAQHEADKKIAEANQDYTTKTTSAQFEADKKVAEANSSFIKARDDYRNNLTAKVTDVEKKIAKLESKYTTATGKAKAELEGALPDIRARQKVLHADMSQIDSVAATAWDALKNKLDTDLEALSRAIDKAPSSV